MQKPSKSAIMSVIYGILGWLCFLSIYLIPDFNFRMNFFGYDLPFMFFAWLWLSIFALILGVVALLKNNEENRKINKSLAIIGIILGAITHLYIGLAGILMIIVEISNNFYLKNFMMFISLASLISVMALIMGIIINFVKYRKGVSKNKILLIIGIFYLILLIILSLYLIHGTFIYR